MIDRDLAELYGVETKKLNQAVKRNLERFPANFMFKLNNNEFSELVTNCDRFKTLKHSTSAPYAFTEYGVVMLSSVLNSKRAIAINVEVVNAFVRMRRYALEHKDLSQRINNIERYLVEQGMELENINKAIDLLMDRTKPAQIGLKQSRIKFLCISLLAFLF
jgi:hypothetical protein